jgi:hypothetical protein
VSFYSKLISTREAPGTGRRQAWSGRYTVFGWAHARLPFYTGSARKLNINQPPVITVVGKAFFAKIQTYRANRDLEKKAGEQATVQAQSEE